MISDKVISISDLRSNATNIIKNLNLGEKYIFIHNKPKAVLIDSEVFEFLEAKGEIPTKSDIEAFKNSTGKGVEAFGFLENLLK
ncbi:hypothetical protein DLH72_02335 [Candidatus Gracilibacteria bacterium]|nr:MAG: hypothetical protein DLH72_02335 [Candidatus Gracilibacteria bacterium]